jgi:hypothetical protein
MRFLRAQFSITWLCDGDFNEVYVGRNILVLMNGNNGK